MMGEDPVSFTLKGRKRRKVDDSSTEVSAAFDSSSSTSMASSNSPQDKSREHLVIPLPQQDAHATGPILLRNRNKSYPTPSTSGSANNKKHKNSDKERFHHDIGERPEADDSQYASIPIETFGAALLRGMGWSESSNVTSSANNSMTPKTALQRVIEGPQIRPTRLGLGAMPKEEGSNGKKGGESKDDQERRLALQERERRQRPWLTVGALVKVVRDRFQGNVGVVRQVEGVPGLSNIVLVVDPGEESGSLAVLPQVMVKRDAVEFLGEEQSLDPTHPARLLLEKYRQESVAEQSRAKQQPNESDEPREVVESAKSNQTREKKSKKGHTSSSSSKRTRCWLRSGIRVRVMSKSLGQGKWYGEKGTVQDVLDQEKKTCILVMDRGKRPCVLEDVRQSQLDTVLPKRGGEVLVLNGKHRGERGTLLDRDKSRCVATVQLLDSMQVVSLDFDDVAEFCHDE